MWPPNFPPQTLFSASLLIAPPWAVLKKAFIHLLFRELITLGKKTETLGRLWLATTLPFFWLCDLSLPRQSTPPVTLSLLHPSAVENFLISLTSVYTFSKMEVRAFEPGHFVEQTNPSVSYHRISSWLISGPPSQVRSMWLLGARIEFFCFLLYPECEILLSTFRKNACLAIVFLGLNSETINIF